MDLHKTFIMNRATIEYLSILIVCMYSLYMISCHAQVCAYIYPFRNMSMYVFESEVCGQQWTHIPVFIT